MASMLCNKSLGTLVKFYYSCFISATPHTPRSKQKCDHEKESLVISILYYEFKLRGDIQRGKCRGILVPSLSREVPRLLLHDCTVLLE